MNLSQSRTNALVARQIRSYIDQELAYFTHDNPPETPDVKCGLDRAKIAISRAFVTFSRNHTLNGKVG